MRIELTKISNERHRLVVVRPDGTRESAELETRSYLLHDLVHYAVEAQAQLTTGFWGTVASGAPFASLSPEAMKTQPPSAALMHVESLVAPVQTLWSRRDDPAAVARMREHYLTRADVDAAFLDGVLERLRRVWGHWQATHFGDAMVLPWPP